MATMTSIKSDAIHEEDVPILQSLAQLQELHDQLNSLRTLLPRRLLAPISTALHPNGTARQTALSLDVDSLNPSAVDLSTGAKTLQSPQLLFTEIGHIAQDGTKEFEAFKETWHSEPMEKLWARGKEMESWDGPQGNDVWAEEHGRFIVDGGLKLDLAADSVKAEPNADEMELDRIAEDENLEKILEEFKEGHSQIMADLEGEGEQVIIKTSVGGMSFDSKRQNGQWTMRAPSQGRPSELQREILKQVNLRKRKGSLKHLLGMLASYTDVKSRKCDKCSMIIDAKFKFPYIRKEEEVHAEGTHEGQQTKWMAYHEACI